MSLACLISPISNSGASVSYVLMHDVTSIITELITSLHIVVRLHVWFRFSIIYETPPGARFLRNSCYLCQQEICILFIHDVLAGICNMLVYTSSDIHRSILPCNFPGNLLKKMYLQSIDFIMIDLEDKALLFSSCCSHWHRVKGQKEACQKTYPA